MKSGRTTDGVRSLLRLSAAGRRLASTPSLQSPVVHPQRSRDSADPELLRKSARLLPHLLRHRPRARPCPPPCIDPSVKALEFNRTGKYRFCLHDVALSLAICERDSRYTSSRGYFTHPCRKDTNISPTESIWSPEKFAIDPFAASYSSVIGPLHLAFPI